MRAAGLFLLLLATLVPLAPSAHAHVTVVPGAGDSAANATELGVPPARAFDELPRPGGYHYYSISLRAGQEVKLRLVGSDDAFPEGLPPSIILVSASLEDTGLRPANLTLPTGMGVVGYVANAQPTPAFDARYPTQWNVHLDQPFVAPRTDQYYVIPYSQEGGGRYALLIEPADGSPILDRYLVISQRLDAYAWNGARPTTSLLAHALGALPILAYLAWRWTKGQRYHVLAKGGAATASVLLAATAASTAWQTQRLHVALATAAPAYALATTGAALATLALAIATRPGKPNWKARAALVLIGIVGLATWNGAIIGPTIAILTAMLPDEDRKTT